MKRKAMTGRPYVVYWNNIPSPYMVERFNALAVRNSMRFEAWFNERIEPDRSWDVDEASWAFEYRYLPRIGVGSRVLHLPTKLVASKVPDVLVSLYASPSFLMGWYVARLRGISTALWCEVTFDAWVKRRWWKERLKAIVLPGADITLGAGEDGRNYAMRYGVEASNALILPHAVDVAHFSSVLSASSSARRDMRRQLGLIGVTFIYVGRLWWGKGLPYLLDAFRLLQRSVDQPVHLLIVGDGVEEKSLREMCLQENIVNVMFVGFKQKGELLNYYAASDVLVFPTLGDPYGLVVDEAMAAGLPVISTRAAGEIGGRVEDGRNGWVVAPGDSEQLMAAMKRMVGDPKVRAEMGQASSVMARGRTPEKWAEDFEAIVKRLLS